MSSSFKWCFILKKSKLRLATGFEQMGHIYVALGDLNKCLLVVLSLRLDALDPAAYEAFYASKNLEDVINRVMKSREETSRGGMAKKLSVRANLMTAIQPMLVRALVSPCQAGYIKHHLAI